MKKLVCITLILCLLFISINGTTAADLPSQKEEIVYGILHADGSVNKLYVVNVFNGGDIIDYGNYTQVRNMTTSETIQQNGDKITIHTEAQKFYYQGTLAQTDLPWDIDITYYLDGKKISANELAGKSGKVKIAISVQQNDKVNRTFFDNYALQISLSLDHKLCSNIQTEDATIAEAGSKKQISYTVLPGNSKEITLTADIRDFEMDAISINGIRLTLGLDVDRDAFSEQVSELASAINGLDDGAQKLLRGLTELSNGMQKYVDGMNAYQNGIQQFASGAERLRAGAVALRDGLSSLTQLQNQLLQGALAIQQATFDAVNATLAEMGLGLPELTPNNYSSILANHPQFVDFKTQLDGAVQFTQGLKGYMEGVAQVGSGAIDLANGTEEFASTSAAIAATANELYAASAEIHRGMKELRNGLAEYKNGTKKLRDGTATMDLEIEKQIDELLSTISGNGEPIVSFVSDKNTNVTAVQFVLKSEAITKPKSQETVEEKPVKLNFWQKLLKLFGL